MENTESKKLSLRTPENLSDQLERLNCVLQNFMVNIDFSPTQHISINNTSCSNNKNTFSDSFSQSELDEDILDSRFEKVLSENDRLKMIIEDYTSELLRNTKEISLDFNKCLTVLNSLKEMICGRSTYTDIVLPTYNLRINILKSETDLPDKQIIENLFSSDSSSNSENVNPNTLPDALSSLILKENEMIKSMQNQFIILCENPVFETFQTKPFSTTEFKQLSLEVEKKNLVSKNKALEASQKELSWKLKEIDLLKTTFLSRISEINHYKKQLEKILRKRKNEFSTFYPMEILQKVPEKRRQLENRPIPECNEESFLNSTLLLQIESSEDDIQIPVPTYMNVSLESLQEQLKFLEEKAATSSDPNKFFVEIERVKTRITTLRGELAIQDCKTSTKNMFKKFKTIEKTVKEENDKRGKLIKQLLRENGNSESIRQEIQDSIGKSINGLEEKRILQKRIGNTDEELLFKQEEMLNELRQQMNGLFKYDETLKKKLEDKKVEIFAKENELKHRERFLMGVWKKQYSGKELVEILEKVSQRLNKEKIKIDEEKEKIENDKTQIFNKGLEVEVEKGRLKSVINQLMQVKKKLENDKLEIDKNLKQINALNSYKGKFSN